MQRMTTVEVSCVNVQTQSFKILTKTKILSFKTERDSTNNVQITWQQLT